MSDARSLSNHALETLRRRAVAMVCGGATQAATAKALGVHKNTVSLWLKWWREGGDAALRPKRRGAPLGTRRRLSAAAEVAIQRLIIDKCPDQLDLPFALWTRPAVRALIEKRFGISISYPTVVDYLRRWGFTPQRSVGSALGAGTREPGALKAEDFSGPA